MSKSRSFSVYLLKEGFDASSALKADHPLKGSESAKLPAGWTMLLYDPAQRQPWWRDYFGVTQTLNQSTKGAIVFVPAKHRTFALSFGPAHFSLKDESYEYDFGLLVTLNCVDPDLIRNTDVLQPGSARRQRTQLASRSDLTYFDFDGDNSVLRTLTGNIRNEYQHLFKFATGASNLRISSSTSLDGLAPLCEQLLELYSKEAYKSAFPGIRNITPVRDPDDIAELDEALMQAVRSGNEDVLLAVPAIIDYNDSFWVMFSGSGASEMYPDVDITDFYKYMASNDKDISKLTLSELRRHELKLVNDDGLPREKFPIYKSLAFDTKLANLSGTYYLSESNWYHVDDDFIQNLRTFLDKYHVDLWLPPCEAKPESIYNEDATKKRSGAICLDTTNTSPRGQTSVEPCDIYYVEDARAVLTHIKIGTASGDLSHLFNQGANAVKLLRSNLEARERLVELLSERGASGLDHSPVLHREFKIEYGIISRKDPSKKSDNLPLFSRISLKRALSDLDLMGVPAVYGFVADQTDRQPSKAKPRKARAKK